MCKSDCSDQQKGFQFAGEAIGWTHERKKGLRGEERADRYRKSSWEWNWTEENMEDVRRPRMRKKTKTRSTNTQWQFNQDLPIVTNGGGQV